MNLHNVQVAMSADFLGAFSRLGKQQQKGVRAWIDKFRADPTSKSINYKSLEGMRDPKVRDALARAPALRFDDKDRLQDDWAAGVAGERIALPTHRIASSTAFVDAAYLGIGWGMNPEPLVRAHLKAGRLVALIPDAPLDVPLHWQVARLTAKALKPLTTAIRRAAAAVLIA